MIPETVLVYSKVEKTMPENRSGKVSNTAVSNRPMGVEEKPPDLAANQPRPPTPPTETCKESESA